MYGLLRTVLFKTTPEQAHHLALKGLKLGHRLGVTQLRHPPDQPPVRVMGLEFPNRVGLAAGLDKNGDYIDALGGLGFGFIEIGTVTPRAQPGNPKPRIFRLQSAHALINRLGFNNKGLAHLTHRAAQRRFDGVLGINIGKNFDTPLDQAANDYLQGLEATYPLADYITINISSPNTKNLRELQGEDALNRLLEALARRREQLSGTHHRRVPLVVKVAPDLDDSDITALARVVQAHDMDGVIATNTTLARDGVDHLPHGQESGGLSGAPLKRRANEVLQALRSELPHTVALIGVGGILSGNDAMEKIQLGADLVQCYTGFVYRGPELVAEVLKATAGHPCRNCAA